MPKGYLMKPFSSFFSLFIVFCFLVYCRKDTSPIVLPPDQTDTTSHNFSWQIDTIGINNSVLFDVAIIDKNDIWAVGEIHTAETDTFDSLGNWVPSYNAVHWNGKEWELKRIPFTGWCSAVEFPPIRSIFAFFENDIWFARSGSLVHYNGISFYNDCGMNTLLDGSINKIWGTNSNNMFIVGGSGTIIHYNGSSWQELESNNTVDLLDIYGSPDGSVVWACGFSDFISTVLLKISGTVVELVYDDLNHWHTIRDDSLSGTLTGVWTDNTEQVYLISPAGMYIAPSSTRGEAQRIWLDNNFLPGFPRALRGYTGCDLFTAGDFSFMAHYNGATWHIYNDFAGRIRSRGIAMTENLVILAGLDIQTNRATIIRGAR
jgi:hypothetical protein